MSRRFLLALLGGGLVTAPLAAQGVMVAPHAVFMNARTNSGVVTLYNPNTEAAEVTIATFFGYPETDSLGQLRLHGMPTSDSAGRMVLPPAVADSGQPSAARWIQAFPRRLTVAPRERQTIRLLAAPPPGLPDGEYWVRLVIAVKGGVVPVTGVADTGIKIGLTLEVRTIIGVNYRKGPVQTGVAVRRLRATVVGDTLEVWPRLERQGNAAFIGTVRGVLVDSAGREHARLAYPIGVYYTMEPRLVAPVGVLSPGRYWLKLTVDTDREDLEPSVVLPAPVVRDSVLVRIP